MTIRRRRGRPPCSDVLTPAEWGVVHALQHGLSNRSIASRLGVSAAAVKFHVRNATAKLALDGRHALRHWQRPSPGDADHYPESPMSARPSITALGQVARSVSDIGRSQTWYTEVLGLRHLYTYGTLAFFDLGGVRLLLTQKDAAAADESILYLTVADIRASHAALAARGVEFLGAPHRIFTHPDGTEEWMAFFKDPDGRPLAIMARVTAGAAA